MTSGAQPLPIYGCARNDIHVPISFDYAERLLEEHPHADGLVVRLRYCCTNRLV